MGFQGYCSFTEAWEMLECGSVRLSTANCCMLKRPKHAFFLLLLFFPIVHCKNKSWIPPSVPHSPPAYTLFMDSLEQFRPAMYIFGHLSVGEEGGGVVCKLEPTRLMAMPALLCAVAAISQNGRIASSLIPAGAMPGPEVTRVSPQKCCPVPVSAPHPL